MIILKTFIVVLCTAFAVFQILRLYGVFEINRSSSKVASTIESERKKKKQRRFEQSKLNIYSTFTDIFRGILLPPLTEQKQKFYIDRLDLRTKYLGRRYTAEEYRGKMYLPFILSLVCIPLATIKIVFLAVPIAFGLRALTYMVRLKQQVYDEDEIIDNNFIKLYLTLFSKLRGGSRARLQGTVESYADTLESQTKTDETEVMLRFTRYFLNLLAMYEDHQAIPHLRDLYSSNVIINFCNVAGQALQGVDNFDNLITFKMQLINRQTVAMRKKQQAILAKGERSIYAIWVILFIFIIVGWYSKLPTGFF